MNIHIYIYTCTQSFSLCHSFSLSRAHTRIQAKAEHNSTWKARQNEEEHTLFKELLENSNSLAGYVHEMQSRMTSINSAFFEGMPQPEQFPETGTNGSQQPGTNGYPDQYFLT